MSPEGDRPSTVTISLDGREVSGRPGMTVLELARESGVDIPTLCHDPHLGPVGACRICVVEDECRGSILAACVTPIAPGMVINTQSPRVVEHRKTIVKLMLASHPDSCLVCDKGNRCQLRQIASDLGIGFVEFQRLPQTAVIQEVNPFLERDLSKCILCAKCIRACQELVVEGAIDYFDRGFVARPQTLDGVPLEESTCSFCGTCVALCPTGALMERERWYRTSEATVVNTTCPFCSCGCSVRLHLKGDRVVRVTPSEEASVNRGALCARGSYGWDFLRSATRLTRPLIRQNGDLTACGWDEALAHVAHELGRIKYLYGGQGIGMIVSSVCTNEEGYLLQRFARGVLDTNNIDNTGRLGAVGSREALALSPGRHGATGTLADLEQSDVILLVGADPASSAPALAYCLKRAVRFHGAELIVVDPRRTELARFARLWLRPNPGSDGVLLNGMGKVIVEEGLTDERSVARSVDNLDDFKRSLEWYSPSHVQGLTSVSPDELSAAARLYAEAQRPSIVFGSDITQWESGMAAVRALVNLPLLTDRMAKRWTRIYPVGKEVNERGLCNMGVLPDLLPGNCSIVASEARSALEERWGHSVPGEEGLSAVEMIQHAKEGRIRALYLVGVDPLSCFPRPDLVREALASVDFLVVQDSFPSDSSALADVVLPVATVGEQEGSVTSLDGSVHGMRRAAEPCGDSLAGWEVICRLAEKMGAGLRYRSLREVDHELGRDVPGWRAFDVGAPEGRRTGPVAAPTSSPGRRAEAPLHLFLAEEIPKHSEVDEQFPFTLLRGSHLYRFGRFSDWRGSRLSKFCPEPFVEMVASDADKLNLSAGEKVNIVSRVGSVTASVKISDGLPQGVVFAPGTFGGSLMNALFDVNLDTQSRAPALTACRVRVERSA